MREISITVRDRVAAVSGSPEIVCGNSDYTAVFDLDAEWDAYPVKIARVVWKDEDTGKMLYQDVLFEGNRAVLPPVSRTTQIWLGIFSGDIRTTTPVRIPCCASESGSNAVHPEPESEIYIQLLRYLEYLHTKEIHAGAEKEICCGAEGICGIPITEEEI